MDIFKNYEVEEQISLFDLTTPIFKIDKPIRLIELFAGVGSQAMALMERYILLMQKHLPLLQTKEREAR